MIFLFLYRVGHFLAVKAPLEVCYGAAIFLADMYYFLWRKERRTVIENLKTVFNDPSENHDLEKMARNIFRNFAKYLVEFFRFSRIGPEYLEKCTRMEGLSYVDESLKRRKGVIVLSVHMGNWELGAFMLSMAGYPTNAVVLTHGNKSINDFFINQRYLGKVKSIEFGASLRGCYRCLKNNELLALLGDRDFSKTGIRVPFFDKVALMPKGPAVLSQRTGAAIVPAFTVRGPDDSHALIFDKPILPDEFGDGETAAAEIMKKYLAVVETYIKRYPGQWYIFRNLWSEHDQDLRPDTII